MRSMSLNKVAAAGLLAALCAAACVRVEEPELSPLEAQIGFGISTQYDNGPVTKTAYSGSFFGTAPDEYERIDWVDGDRIRIVSAPATAFKNGDYDHDHNGSVGYDPAEVNYADYTLKLDKNQNQYSYGKNVTAVGNDNRYLRWKDEDTPSSDYYFISAYPLPGTKDKQGTDIGMTMGGSLTVDAGVASTTLGGTIPAAQKYTECKVDASAKLREFLPDMSYAYMYAGAKVEKKYVPVRAADVLARKVDLHYKPLFTAFAFTVAAGSAIAKEYTLQRIELTSEAGTEGSDLTGKFVARVYTKAQADAPGTGVGTGDFALTGSPTETGRSIAVEVAAADQAAMGDYTFKFTLFALPVEQKGLTLHLTFKGKMGETQKLKLPLRIESSTPPGPWATVDATRKLYLSMNPNIVYTFEVEGPRLHFARTGDGTEVEKQYSVFSYKTVSGVTKKAVKWTAKEFSSDGSSWSTTKPAWLTGFTDNDNGSTGAAVSYTGKVADNGSPTEDAWAAIIAESAKSAEDKDKVRDLSRFTVFNASDKTAAPAPMTTANSYVVSGRGWYKIPAVYGNAIKGGADQPAAYTGPASGTGVMTGGFHNHNGDHITKPWITKSSADGGMGIAATTAVVLWQDVDDLISSEASFGRKKDGSAGDGFAPFFDEDYIYFFVEKIAQGNAVLALKDASGTIVWSWHIWVIPPGSLSEILVEPNPMLYKLTSLPSPYNTDRSNPLFSWTHGPQNVNFLNLDLGEVKGEADVADRKIWVRFTQDESGETATLCLVQNGVKTGGGGTPFYQWGRKDPMWPARVSGDLTKIFTPANHTGTTDIPYQAASEANTVAQTIQAPDKFFLGRNAREWTWAGKKRYDNLWNTNYLTQVAQSNQYDGAEINVKPGTSTEKVAAPGIYHDVAEQKTVYDPCPPGFKVPGQFDFTGFNSLSTFRRVPSITGVAEKFPASYTSFSNQFKATFKLHFYTKYKADPASKRDQKSPLIAFTAMGQRNGGGTTPNYRNNKTDGFYWTSAPHHFSFLYGRTFHFQEPILQSSEPSFTTMVYPIHGIYKNSSGTWESGWLRSHGQIVRPVRE